MGRSIHIDEFTKKVSKQFSALSGENIVLIKLLPWNNAVVPETVVMWKNSNQFKRATKKIDLLSVLDLRDVR